MSSYHGSKVKAGDYKECKIASHEGKVYIIVNSERGEIIHLNSDTIESYEYVKEKKRMVGLELKTYFYYNLYFKSGAKSYVRMSRKKRDAMLAYTH